MALHSQRAWLSAVRRFSFLRVAAPFMAILAPLGLASGHPSPLPHQSEHSHEGTSIPERVEAVRNKIAALNQKIDSSKDAHIEPSSRVAQYFPNFPNFPNFPRYQRMSS
jgi:hypothetical protein